jgi:DNA-binding XRE family transcriptional regulator
LESQTCLRSAGKRAHASENDLCVRVHIFGHPGNLTVSTVRRLPAKHLKQFGQNVIHLRNGAKMTQEQLAEKVGISARYFQSIEAGKRWPSIGVLMQLRHALDCHWNDLFRRLD